MHTWCHVVYYYYYYYFVQVFFQEFDLADLHEFVWQEEVDPKLERIYEESLKVIHILHFSVLYCSDYVVTQFYF